MHSVAPMSGSLIAIGVALWAECPAERLLGWLLTTLAAIILRRFVCHHILSRIDEAPDTALARYDRHLLLTAIPSAATSGAGVWWLGGISTEIDFFVTLVCCFHMIAGMVNASSELTSFVVMVSTSLSQVMVYWLMQGVDGVRVAVLLGAVVYLLCMFGRYNARTFADSVRIRAENVDLLAALSEEKKAVERALAAEEEANLAKSRFLAAASHDLRQPLHALSLWTGLLQDTLTNPKAIERGAKIAMSVEVLDKMFSGLLDLSRFDAGSIVPEKRQLSLQHILRGIENDFSGAAQAKGLQLRVASTAAWVYSDSLWLERILRNLLSNAIKYTQHGSVSVACDAGTNTVRVSVRDTGIGIGPDQQQRVFEEYYQIHNPSRNRDQGVGLGLAIVKRACDLLGHTISVRSEPGVGSEFSVVLPACAPETVTMREPSLPEEPGQELQGLVVVVVEDDAHVAEAMAEMLGEWGCVPIVSPDADTAIALLSSRGLVPWAIISDYRLRENLTGVDVIDRLRATYGPLPAVLVSGEVSLPELKVNQNLDYPVVRKPLAPSRIRSLLLQIRATI